MQLNLGVLIKNTSSLMLAEVVAKASRLVSIMAMATFLSASLYGAVMLALTIHEVLRLLLRSGAGAQVVRASDEQLPSYVANAWYIQWLLCTALCLLQIAVAVSTIWLFPDHEISTLIIAMAFTYLLFPAVSIKVFMLQRDNKMGLISFISSVCLIAENLTIAVALYFDASIYAVVYAKWVYSVLWLALFMVVKSPQFNYSFEASVFKYLMFSSSKLALSEVLRALRINADTFIAARLLTPDLFGLYSFAKSAGMGLALSFSQAYTSALYPYICRQTQKATISVMLAPWLLAATAFVSVVIVVQAFLVPFYVPLLFGSQWDSTHGITTLLCFIAVCCVWIDTYSGVLRSEGLFTRETQLCAYCLSITLLFMLTVRPDNPQTLAVLLLSASALWLLFPVTDLIKRYLRKSHNALV